MEKKTLGKATPKMIFDALYENGTYTKYFKESAVNAMWDDVRAVTDPADTVYAKVQSDISLVKQKIEQAKKSVNFYEGMAKRIKKTKRRSLA